MVSHAYCDERDREAGIRIVRCDVVILSPGGVEAVFSFKREDPETPDLSAELTPIAGDGGK